MTTGWQRTPFAWQVQAQTKVLEGWMRSANYRALIAACPGAGKTRFAVQLADDQLRLGKIELVLVVVPTINIQKQWIDELEAFGIKATADASNESLRWRRDKQHTMREDKNAIVITYAQLARDADLFAELVRRHPTLLIADEIHHADDDEKFGQAIEKVRDGVVHSLALSGTPFNSEGGALALCESVDVIDQDTGRPMRSTVATYSYGYGEAIVAQVCRTAEFVKVEGTGRATYRSLTDNSLYQRLLKTMRKTDPIGLLLDPKGEYIGQCIREALTALARMRAAGDRRAAMLVVARDTKHGNLMVEAIERIIQERPEWAQFTNIQAIYNDSEKAHARIKALNGDNTDIVVSVRMISEGVDIKRLRVGLYATDTSTRMFFIQFVGRFVRTDDRLDNLQHAVVVFPAHPDLLKYTLEIEKMILASQIKLVPDDTTGPPPGTKSELIGVETSADASGLIYRGQESERGSAIIDAMRKKSSVFISMPDSLVLQAANDLGIGTGMSGTTAEPKPINWTDRNHNLAKQIVRYLRSNGESDQELFKRVNGRANAHVGIHKMDGMTPDAVLQKRHAFLQDQLRRILNEINPDMFQQ